MNWRDELTVSTVYFEGLKVFLGALVLLLVVFS